MQTQCHYLPNASERLLLQALLAEEKSAVIAAQAWLDTVDLDAINQGIQRMVPLLYFRMGPGVCNIPVGPKSRPSISTIGLQTSACAIKPKQ